MADNKNIDILIIEDARGIAEGYRSLLRESGYRITICHTGEETQSLIDKEQKFSLAILDIVLSVEDPAKYTLAECQETGLRLIKQMIEKEICNRFYVITVRKTLKDRIELLCKGKEVVLKFEYKLDHEPEKFSENVAELLRQSPDVGDTLLVELREHVDVVEGYVRMLNLLSEADKEQLMASMTSIQKILKGTTNPNLGIDLKRAESILRLRYIRDTTGVMKMQAERTLAGIEEWFKKRT